MSLLPSILVPLDGSATAARSLGCAAWLATRCGARLHVLVATDRIRPAGEALASLRVDERHWPLIELHQATGPAATAVLAAVADHGVRLVVMSARGATEAQADTPPSSKLVGHVTQAVIERSSVPVLLLPKRYREVLPWTRVLVPVNGGVESDAALALAARLAQDLDLSVQVAHVTGVTCGREDCLEARARYADALHHEYQAQLDELVRRAIAPADRHRVQQIALGHGDIVTELVERIEGEQISVLVVGWHGHFTAGRAHILKRLLGRLHAPVLLVKAPCPPRSRLIVGEELG